MDLSVIPVRDWSDIKFSGSGKRFALLILADDQSVETDGFLMMLEAAVCAGALSIYFVGEKSGSAHSWLDFIVARSESLHAMVMAKNGKFQSVEFKPALPDEVLSLIEHTYLTISTPDTRGVELKVIGVKRSHLLADWIQFSETISSPS